MKLWRVELEKTLRSVSYIESETEAEATKLAREVGTKLSNYEWEDDGIIPFPQEVRGVPDIPEEERDIAIDNNDDAKLTVDFFAE